MVLDELKDSRILVANDEAMSARVVEAILSNVSYKDWTFRVGVEGKDFWLQVIMWSGVTAYGGRKWRLSTHMTRSEVVQTALKAILTAEEHEARERFKYRGEAVYGPHLDVEALYEIAHEKRIDTRE